MQLLQARRRFHHLSEYLAAFTVTGRNKIRESASRAEVSALRNRAPAWIRAMRPVLCAMRLMEKAFSGAYSQRSPLEYSIYTKPEQLPRRSFSVANPSFRLHW